MKGSAKYIILLFMLFFWSCIDFDRIIEYRETLYGGCCEYGKEVELRRAEKHGFGNTEFEKNSLFVSSDNDFFFYQNPKSFWDHSFTFSDEGIAGNIEISKGGEIFAVASQGSDSVVTNVEFYTISGGIPLQLERELQILKASENEYLQEYKLLFGDDYISMLFRDDSLRTNRVKFLRFNADSSKWVGVNYRNEEIHDLILDDAETIIKFQPVYSFDNDEIYVLTTDTDKNFKFYRQNSTEWYEPGLRSHGGEQTLPDSLKAHSFTYSNSMLLLSTVGQDTTILEQYFFDEFESRFIKRNGDLVGESAFLEKSTKLEYLRYQYR